MSWNDNVRRDCRWLAAATKKERKQAKKAIDLHVHVHVARLQKNELETEERIHVS